MSLEEEISLCQFGQGVRSLADMLDQFRTLESEEQRSRFVFLYCELNDRAFANADIAQALADFPPDDKQALHDYLHLYRFTANRTGIVYIPASDAPPNGELAMAYQVLLALFKIRYQRQFVLEKDKSMAWQYQDLSDPAVAESLLIRHQNLVDQVYDDPGYRSEFVCLAKSWRNDELRRRTPASEPSEEPQTHFNFITYDELITDIVAPFADGTMRGLGLLRQSLNKALAKQHRLSDDQANRLVVDVINKYLREMSN